MVGSVALCVAYLKRATKGKPLWKFAFEMLINFFSFLNLLKPISYVMHQQFNIQQLYVLPTLYLCVLYLSENKQRLVPLTA